MADLKTTDEVIEELGGCRLFQWVFVLLVFLGCFTGVWSTMFMGFGNYNPGWRCVHQNSSVESGNESFPSAYSNGLPSEISVLGVLNNSSLLHNMESQTCAAYSTCNSIEFYPTASTIVTEWGLICDKNWIVNIITSLQMAGAMAANFIGGQLSDRFGRKTMMFVGIALNGLFNAIAVFSPSWIMYAVLRFCIGFGSAIVVTIHTVYCLEFIPNAWRPALSLFPKWNFGAMLLAVFAMFLKDWKHLHILTAACSFGFLVSALWLPESFRWFIVRSRTDSAYKVTQKIASWNRSTGVVGYEAVERIALLEHGHTVKRQYSVLTLFKKALVKRTLISLFVFFTMNIQYYVIAFGVKALSGNLYVNLILAQSSSLPLLFLTQFLAVKVGRKKIMFIYISLGVICCFAIVPIHFFVEPSTAGTVIMILAICIMAFIATAWGMFNSYSNELFPTVIRGLAFGFLNSLARSGAVIAPFLIPADPNDLYISYLIMGVLGVLCIMSMFLLPETKNRPMNDTIHNKVIVVKVEVEDGGARGNVSTKPV